MSALTSPLGAMREHGGTQGLICRQSRISVTYQRGSLVARRIGSKLAEIPLQASPRTDLVFLGTFVGCGEFAASSNDDGNGGALWDDDTIQEVSAEPGIVGWFDNGTGAHEIKEDDIGEPCFAYNDNTLYKDDLGGTLSFVGLVEDVNSAGKVKVNIDPKSGLWRVFATSNYRTESIKVRGVVYANVSDLTAFTVSNNGITYVAGDRVLLAVQTTAAQCGVYIVGTVSSGTAPLTRAPEMPAGLTLPGGTTIEVGPEGTYYGLSTWKATATAPVIGTNDPVFYPKVWKQTVTLASGTYTIGVGSTANPDEPLFLLTDATVHVTRNTHAGTLGTDGYEAPSGSRVTGKAGTAVIVVNSINDNGSTGSSDTSTVDVLATNW